jgi:hypothetical protein
MRADKSNPTELRRTAEAVARKESITKASIILGIKRSTVRRRMAAYCALPSDQFSDGEPRSVRSSDQTPNGAPMCAQSSDAVPDGAPVCTAPDLSSFALPPGSHLHWCELTADEGWQCVAEDSWTARQRVIRSELIENRVRVYDPGVIYPPDWTGPAPRRSGQARHIKPALSASRPTRASSITSRRSSLSGGRGL